MVEGFQLDRNNEREYILKQKGNKKKALIGSRATTAQLPSSD